MDFHAVGPAVILHGELPFTLGVDPEYPAEGDVDDPQITVAIEARSLEETLDFHAAAIRFGPFVATFLAKMCGQGSENLRLDVLGLLKRVVHSLDRSSFSSWCANLPQPQGSLR
jgi:hypothetical protein